MNNKIERISDTLVFNFLIAKGYLKTAGRFVKKKRRLKSVAKRLNGTRIFTNLMIFEDILSLFYQCKLEKEVLNICDALVYNHLKKFCYDKTAQKLLDVRKKCKFLSIPQELNLEKVIEKNPLFCFYDSAVKSFRRSNRIKDIKRTQIDIFIEKLNIIGENDSILPLKIVYNLPEKNRGIVTTKNISQGDFVVEYAGELIDDKTASIRELQYTEYGFN